MRAGRPRRTPLLIAVAALAVAVGSQLPTAFAAAPTADRTVTLPATPGKDVATFSGHAPFNGGQANILFDDVTGACDGSTTPLRDEHTVRVRVPQKPDPKYDVLIRFAIDWSSPTPEFIADMRLDLFGPDGKLVASSDGSQFQEGINLTEPAAGVYSMHTCAFSSLPNGQDFTGKVTAETIKPKTTPTAVGVKAPTYHQFTAPKDISDDAGEPSIGNNWKTNHTFFTSYIHEYDVSFNDTKDTSKWTAVSLEPNTANRESFDPIGFTDSRTGRTFVSQLFLVCSGTVYTDDDFKSASSPSEGCGSGLNGFDHQTIGGGRFPKGMSGVGYEHAVYYCSQATGLLLGNATCARSDTGGILFGAPISVFDGKCNGLHGHVRVAPNDGTVYLPNSDCGGKQGMAVSTDGGATWRISRIPGSIAGDSDPSVSAGNDGTVYFGFADGTGRPMIAVSHDRGKTWDRVVNIGTGAGIHNTEFSEVMAGDGNRAAFAFLGTSTRGSTQAASFGKNAALTKFTGARWNLYVATTYNRGKTWTTVNATPNDPIQRGCIWNSGGSNDCRNLLDFNDITVDKIGRVMVGLADGCVSHSVEPQSSWAYVDPSDPLSDYKNNNYCTSTREVAKNGLVQHGAIVRQQSGKGLFAKYDGLLPGSGYTLPGSSGGSTPNDGSGTNDGDSTDSGTNGSPVPAVTGSTPLLGALATLVALGAIGLRVWRRRHAAAAI